MKELTLNSDLAGNTLRSNTCTRSGPLGNFSFISHGHLGWMLISGDLGWMHRLQINQVVSLSVTSEEVSVENVIVYKDESM